MDSSQRIEHRKKTTASAICFRLAWLLLVVALFYGLHRYFEYRNQELDKRLERLRSF